MVTIREVPLGEYWGPGHSACAGCGPSITIRLILKALRRPTVVVTPTGCMEIVSSSYPQTAWGIPWIHVLFENAAAVASGIEAAYKYMAKKGLLEEKVDVVVIAGDGGTFDIGIQALSGALERWHKFTYICYDNEAYMNTGIQRSSATPKGAATTTSPAGEVIPGKLEYKKNLIEIAVAHHIPYAATGTIAYWSDLMEKVRKSLEADGPAVLHFLAPCPLGWRFDPSQTVKLSRLAVQTRYFPIYEVENEVYKLNVKVAKPLPVEEFLKPQGRFRHLFTPKFKHVIEDIQKNVDGNWKNLLEKCTVEK
ncbi:pyruvate ferredoxin oxidoreductase [Candidatus Bathyarchaeota archaeon]|nr:pyruvate ferredoxin oxidoreductase [Candidatus Bathyarchaeota archaeon]MBS7618910.1 pyruvate ferredoxin oxidoreductase [Candidatus Bathyarchaeota archaeon]